MRNISGASGSCSTQLTTMSCSARNAASGHSAVVGERAGCAVGSSVSWSKCTMRTEWIGEPTAATPRLVRTSTSCTPCALSAVTAPRAVAPKPMTAALQPPAVVAGRPDQLQGVQHRAVAGQLVVLVEHVQAERAVGGPVVHRLERDQGQPPVDGQLGDLRVLDAVRPAPQRSARRAAPRRPAASGLGSRTTSHSRDESARGAAARPRTAPTARRRRRTARRSQSPGRSAPEGRRRSARRAADGSAAVARSPCATAP